MEGGAGCSVGERELPDSKIENFSDEMFKLKDLKQRIYVLSPINPLMIFPYEHVRLEICSLNARHNIKLCFVIGMLLSCKCLMSSSSEFELNLW